MAIATILRRTASAATPLVTRAISRSQKYHNASALLSAAVNRGLSRQALSRSLLPSAGRCYSSRPSSDESLLRVIDSELKCAEESDDQNVVSLLIFVFWVYRLFFIYVSEMENRDKKRKKETGEAKNNQ